MKKETREIKDKISRDIRIFFKKKKKKIKDRVIRDIRRLFEEE